jgi:hypothetical protein
MSDKAKETKYIKNQVTDEERCLFTTNHGNRCRNPHLGNATRHCFLHEGRNQKAEEAEVQAVADELLNKNVGLATRDDVNRITSQLFTMLAEKRISRQDGSLLAYVASVLLQTITPVRRRTIVPERAEFVESVAAPIRDVQAEFSRKLAERFPPEPQMPGRTYNPYMHPGKLR